MTHSGLHLLALAALSAASLGLAAPGRCQKPRDEVLEPLQPNILLIIADDLGAEQVGCYDALRCILEDTVNGQGSCWHGPWPPLCTP